MTNIAKMQKAIQDENLDGWLFLGFHHRDEIALKLLDIDTAITNSRQWIYFIPANGNPVKILHGIEKSILKHLPGEEFIFTSREMLNKELKKISVKYPNIGVQYSDTLAIISFLDYGSAKMLIENGFTLNSSAELIQRVIGILSEEGIKSHQKAANHLYEIIELSWSRIEKSFKSGKALTETEVQAWILDEFKNRNMVTDHSPIVGFGVNTSDPHYAPDFANETILEANQIIQFDMWAKLNGKDDIYADISWLAFSGTEVPDEINAVFKTVVEARDSAVSFIQTKLNSDEIIYGKDVDTAARSVIIKRGFEKGIHHRTGHGIDTNVHGSGTGPDSVEFPDTRRLMEYSCFSIEPGLYFEKFGCRTEIDVFIKDKKAVVSGKMPQKEILTFK